MGMGDLSQEVEDAADKRCVSPCDQSWSMSQNQNRNQESTRQFSDSSSESGSESNSDSESESSHETYYESDIDSDSELPFCAGLNDGSFDRISRVSVNMILAKTLQDNAAMSDDEEEDQDEPEEEEATSIKQGQMVPAEPIPVMAIQVAEGAFEAA